MNCPATAAYDTVRHAVLSTLCSKSYASGHPSGAVVEFAVDGQGRPLLATSTMSPHTQDLIADGKCSLTVQAPGWKVGGGIPVCGNTPAGQIFKKNCQAWAGKNAVRLL